MTLDAIIPRTIARYRPIPQWVNNLRDESDKQKLKKLIRSGRKLNHPDGIKFYINNIKTVRDANAICHQLLAQGWGGRIVSKPKARPIKLELYHSRMYLDEETFTSVKGHISRIAAMYGAKSAGWESKFVRQPYEYWDTERLSPFYDITCTCCKRTHVAAFYAITSGERIISILSISYYCHDSNDPEDVFVEMCFGDLSSDNEKTWKKNMTIACHINPAASNYHDSFSIVSLSNSVKLDKKFGKRLTVEQAAASPHYATVWQVLEYIGTTGHYKYLQKKAREM